MDVEATMICIDNSGGMRNRDYSPSRFRAQADAINLICATKFESNSDNTVGLLTMASYRKGVKVLASDSSNQSQIASLMNSVEIGGEMNLTTALDIAQLSLKDLPNKNQRLRIIAFVGSSVSDLTKRELEMFGGILKKSRIALDVISFGEQDDGKIEKLSALVAAAAGNNNGGGDDGNKSHFVNVPPGGPGALSDMLVCSPIFPGGDDIDMAAASAAAAAAASAAAAAAASAAAAAAAAASLAGLGIGGGGFEFGHGGGFEFDEDPELALAIQRSMDEEIARQEAAAAARQAD